MTRPSELFLVLALIWYGIVDSSEMNRNENLFQLVGWPMYIIRNAAGQRRYPSGSNRSYSDPLDMVISDTLLQTSIPTP